MTKPLPNLNFFFFFSYWDILAALDRCVFSESRCTWASRPKPMAIHSLLGFSGYRQTFCYHQLWQIIQTITLWPMFDSWYDVLFMKCYVSFMADVTETFQLLSHQFTEYFLKSCVDHKDGFWHMWDEPLTSFWLPGTLTWMLFLPLFLTAELWTASKTLAGVSVCFCDLMDESKMHFWRKILPKQCEKLIK